jgi:hypothetical protein
LASAIFASSNPKICLLLQAGYYSSLHSAPRFKAKDEKKSILFLHLPPVATSRGGGCKTFYLLRLPLVLAALQHSTTEKYVYLLFCLAERHGKGVPRGNVLARFLDTSCRVARSVIKKQSANARSSVSARLRKL